MVNAPKSPALLAVGILACGACMPLTAQSVTVLSNGGDARNCSTYAEYASKDLFLPSDAYDTCSRALDHGALSRDDRAATLVNRGIVQVSLRQYQQALEDYTAAMQLQPELPEAYVSRGNLWFLAENFDRAISDYDKSLSLRLSRAYVAFYNRGLAYERKGDSEKAIADFRQASQLQPTWSLPQQKIDRMNEAAASTPGSPQP